MKFLKHYDRLINLTQVQNISKYGQCSIQVKMANDFFFIETNSNEIKDKVFKAIEDFIANTFTQGYIQMHNNQFSLEHYDGILNIDKLLEEIK